MTLKIYGIGASRAVRPLWAAAELGLTFEHVSVPYQGGATRTPEFLALNPNGHIPVIEDIRPEGKVTVWESMACALYIAKVHGQADGQSITPATAQEEADALRWSFWTVTEVEKDALTVLMHRRLVRGQCLGLGQNIRVVDGGIPYRQNLVGSLRGPTWFCGFTQVGLTFSRLVWHLTSA